MTAVNGAGNRPGFPGAPQTDVGKPETNAAAGPPDLDLECFGEMGVEGLAATLSVESAQSSAKLMRDLSREEKHEQIEALNRQVGELHEKADAVRAEGWATGGATAIGGVVTAAGGLHDFGAATAKADAVVRVGQNFGTLGANVAKATAGAAQVEHDADATRAAADAKFHEAAKDDYDSIARDAKGVVDRVQQTLQNIAQERAAARRAILRSA